MAKPKLSDWLQERVSREGRLCLMSPLLLIPGAVLATVVTGWAVFMTILMGFGMLFALSFNQSMGATGLVIGILYLWQFTKGRTHREEWQFSGREMGITDLAVRVVTGSPFAVLALDPAAGKMFVRMLATLLLSGPRLLVLAWDLVQRGRRLKELDVAACTKVLSILLKRQSRVSMKDLLNEVPQATLQTALPQLGDVDGVVFLSTAPIGLTLAPRFQKDFEEWRKAATATADSTA